jgi:hypothetical protein
MGAVAGASGLPGAEELFASARSFARTALDAHSLPDARRAAMDAGTALEHLIKACLAKRSPVLLLDLHEKNWEPLLVVLGQLPASARIPHSISLSTAITRFRALVTSGPSKDDLTELVQLRNGVVHVGAQLPLGEHVFTAFLRQVDVCVADYGVERGDFWSEHLAAVDALLADRASRIERVVGSKLAMAKQRYVERFSGFAPDLVKALVGTQDLPGEYESHRTCPACGALGVARGDHRVDYDYEYDRDGDIVGGAWVEFDANSFACPACRLRLDSPEELSQAGMETTWRDDDVDPSDLEPEHDYDYYDLRDDHEDRDD